MIFDINEILKMPSNHSFYKFLQWISVQYNNSLFLDVGTRSGASAIALAFNSSNTVYTYDIKKRLEVNANILSYPNIIFQEKNSRDISKKEINSASFIYLDISHNGTDERIFLDLLEKYYFNGILIMDDVNCPRRWPKLHDLFMGLSREHYLCPKEISNLRGSGLVLFGNNTIEWKI